MTSNTLTAVTEGLFNAQTPGCSLTGSLTSTVCQYVDPSPIPDGSGHNYFDSRTDYDISSYAVFGEAYYNLTDDLRVTAGLRYTTDKKRDVAYTPGLFLPGSGLTALPEQKVALQRTDWAFEPEMDAEAVVHRQARCSMRPTRAATSGGGFNPPQSAGPAPVSWTPRRRSSSTPSNKAPRTPCSTAG